MHGKGQRKARAEPYSCRCHCAAPAEAELGTPIPSTERRSISGGSSTSCWEPTTIKLLLRPPLLLGRAETGTHRVPGAQPEAQLCVWMGEAGTKPAQGSQRVPALQTHFEGDFFLCLGQSPGQPLQTAPSQQMHRQLSPAIRSGQAKAHPKCGAWVFGGAM